MANYQPTDIINMALAMLGYPRRIGDIWEGSRASLVALDLYGESRDETLRLKNWPFARRTVTLSILKRAGTPLYGGGVWSNSYPPPGWLYQCQTPSDLLMIRQITPSPITFPMLNPRAVRYTFYNDTTLTNANGQASRCILTNIDPAICNYTGQILDPMTWEPLFLNAVVQTLANKMKYALGTQPELLAKEIPQEEMAAVEAADTRGP